MTGRAWLLLLLVVAAGAVGLRAWWRTPPAPPVKGEASDEGAMRPPSPPGPSPEAGGEIGPAAPQGRDAPREGYFVVGEVLPRGEFPADVPRLVLPDGDEEVRGGELADALLATKVVWIRWADAELRRRAREAVAPVPRTVLREEGLPAAHVLAVALEALGACGERQWLRAPVLYVGAVPAEEGSSPR